jgi:ABC-type transport system substrate-binding protein
MTVISREVDVKQAELIQQMLAKADIRLELEIMERTAAVDKVRGAGDFQMYTQRSPNLSDPDSYLSMVWDSSSPRPFHRVKIDAMDKALAEARSALDPEVRHQKYVEVQKIMYETAWRGFMWAEPSTYAWNKRLHVPEFIFSTNLQEGDMWLDV